MPMNRKITETNDHGRYERDARGIGYRVDADGYIIAEVVYHGEPPEGVITVEIPADIDNPRWDFEAGDWVNGDGYEFDIDPVDALAAELLEFKIQYNSVPCQNHEDYPALIDGLMEGKDE